MLQVHMSENAGFESLRIQWACLYENQGLWWPQAQVAHGAFQSLAVHLHLLISTNYSGLHCAHEALDLMSNLYTSSRFLMASYPRSGGYNN